MKDHSENTLRAAIKCLRETVTPAVDPNDPQATEQLRLTIDFLEFLRTRLYDIHARHRYELGHQLDVARGLLDDAALVSAHAHAALDAAVQQATSVYDAVDAHTRDLRAASEELWACVRGVIRESRGAPDELRARIATAVVAGTDPLVQMESAWYLPFGFEPDPAAVQPLADLLPRAPSAGP